MRAACISPRGLHTTSWPLLTRLGEPRNENSLQMQKVKETDSAWSLRGSETLPIGTSVLPGPRRHIAGFQSPVSQEIKCVLC